LPLQQGRISTFVVPTFSEGEGWGGL